LVGGGGGNGCDERHSAHDCWWGVKGTILAGSGGYSSSSSPPPPPPPPSSSSSSSSSSSYRGKEEGGGWGREGGRGVDVSRGVVVDGDGSIMVMCAYYAHHRRSRSSSRSIWCHPQWFRGDREEPPVHLHHNGTP